MFHGNLLRNAAANAGERLGKDRRDSARRSVNVESASVGGFDGKYGNAYASDVP